MKITDLDPQLFRLVTPVDYEPTDDVAQADALRLACPACHWAGQRTGVDSAHPIMLWRDRAHWRFDGSDIGHLSAVALRRTTVAITAGHAHFNVRDGKVDFH